MHLPTMWAWLTARAHLGERDERGANLVEYILLVALIALAVILAIIFFRGQVQSKFSEAGTSLQQAPG
jgi:Flp pilus assembly pilin Flp